MTMTTNTKTHTPTAISAVSRATQCTLHKQQKNPAVAKENALQHTVPVALLTF